MKKIRIDQSKVLFLDIDGVLNSDSFFCSKYHNFLRLFRGEQGVMHDPRAVKLLGKICKATNCKIVMSSTWKAFYFKKDKNAKFLSRPLKKDLKKYGIIIEDYTDWEYNYELADLYSNIVWDQNSKTSSLAINKNKKELKEFYGRGLEISNWLKKHPEVKQYVVLDDVTQDLPLFGNVVSLL